MEGFDIQQEALLKKRKRDDVVQKKKQNNRARQKMAQVRQKKADEKIAIAGGKKVLLPEVYVSNYMKQQRNFVQYKRMKKAQGPRYLSKEAAESGVDKQCLVLPADQRVPVNSLILVVRIKESRNATPQAQKILKELGLKEINNCSFVRATRMALEKLLMIQNYVGWGAPTKKTLEDIVRKRGYLRSKEQKRLPISDNVIVEELLGEKGIICVEDIIEAFWKCKSNELGYNAVSEAIWPIQLASLQETSDKANIKHDATGRDIKRVTTRVHKGGYLGNMGEEVNNFVAQLI